MAEYKSAYTGEQIDAGIGKANTAVQAVEGKGLSTNDYTDADKTKLSGIDMSTKQDTLVSGENIKTINGNSILGEGNLAIEGGTGGLSSVAHDNTMTGAGTNESPLGVDSTKFGTYSKPSGGIPKTDLAEAVQTSLEKADTAIQDISGKQDIMQYSTMPTASADYLNKIVQYIGTTDSNYTNGYFYKCLSFETLYYWEALRVQADPTLPVVFVTYGDTNAYTTIYTSLIMYSEKKQYFCIYNNIVYRLTKTDINNSKIIFTALEETTNNIIELTSSGWSTSTKNLQEQLVSGTNIKTINNQSILGEGNLNVGGTSEISMSLSGTVLTLNGVTLDLAPIFNTRNFVYYSDVDSDIEQIGTMLYVKNATVTQSGSTLSL